MASVSPAELGRKSNMFQRASTALFHEHIKAYTIMGISATVERASRRRPRFLDINEDSIASPPKLAMSIISTPVVPSQYRTSTLGILLMPSF
jgi:hypothetical protein